ncbi:MAG: GDP-L-fucose synthase family protein [Sphingomonadaceae bacterium]
MDFFAGKRVCVAGPNGMVGAAIIRALASTGCDILRLGRAEADLRDQHAVRQWFADQRPQIVFLAAAKVGGILANDSFPADFLYDNLMIEANVFEAAHRHAVEKLLFLGSSCIYPKLAPQPMREDALLTGPLEPTNIWYAVAKIAGIKLADAFCAQHGCNFISAMPTNLYGPGDNFDLNSSHVLPALVRKIVTAHSNGAASVTIWGTGAPLREFLHVDDCASACLHLMTSYSEVGHVNVGSGEEISIADLAALISYIVGYDGALVFDASKPDGTPRKLMDSGKLKALGWQPTISLHEGITQVVRLVEASNGQLRALDLAGSAPGRP